MLNVLVDDPQGVARKEKELWKLFYKHSDVVDEIIDYQVENDDDDHRVDEYVDHVDKMNQIRSWILIMNNGRISPDEKFEFGKVDQYKNMR